MTEQAPSFWATIPGKIIRWIAFLPIGIIACGIIQILNAWMLTSLFTTEIEKLTFGKVLICIILAPISFALYVSHIYGIIGSLAVSCGVIAPNKKVASVIMAIWLVLGIAYSFTLPGESPWYLTATSVLDNLVMFFTLFGLFSATET